MIDPTYPGDFGGNAHRLYLVRKLWRPLSTVKSPCITCVQYRGGDQYRGGVSTVGDIMSTLRGYLEYRGVFSTVGDIMINAGVILSTVEVFSTMGGYHDACGGIS